MDALSFMTDGFSTGNDTTVITLVSNPPPLAPLVEERASTAAPGTGADTNTLGVFQSDVIIRSALQSAIDDLRANPRYLDYVFASLPRDSLTRTMYGEDEVKRAKEWFLRHHIEIHLNVNGEPPSFPCISIALLESSEVAAEATLGEIDPEVAEFDDSAWPVLAGPFTPQYQASTGTVTLPASVNAPVFEGMYITDVRGRGHQIIEVLDDSTFLIAEDTVADFSQATLRGARPAFKTSLGSACFRETYSLGVHAHGKPVHCIYLHTILVFCLLRYRKTLLEARGFERTTISSSDLRRNDSTEQENVFSRYLSVQGFVRHWWPLTTSQRIVGVTLQTTPAGIVREDESNDDVDVLGGKP